MPAEEAFLPADDGAERALLATQVNWPDSIRAISEQVRPEMYYYPEHRRLAETLIDLDVNRGPEAIDERTIARRYLEITKQVDSVEDIAIIG